MINKLINFYIFFIFVSTSLNAHAQKVIIGSTPINKLLTWIDFKGMPDAKSSFDAMTYWSINYKVDKIKELDAQMVFEGFEVVLKFDSSKSWSKPAKATVALLTHEQGHFNIGLICMKEILLNKAVATFNKKNFNEKLQNIFSTAYKKYQDMGLKYDEETNHSKNNVAQLKWDLFFKEQLAL